MVLQMRGEDEEDERGDERHWGATPTPSFACRRPASPASHMLTAAGRPMRPVWVALKLSEGALFVH